MTVDPGLYSRAEEALRRGPDTVWVGEDLALLGWGVAHRLDPGVGPERFHRARQLLLDTGAPLALASFTFDEEVPGSVVVVPELLLRLDSEGSTVVIGDAGRLPPPGPAAALPQARLIEDDTETWRRAVDTALAAIFAEEVEKVVLSRVCRVEATAELTLPELVRRLLAAEPESQTFLVDRLVGSSPELLVSLKAGRVHSVSLAGSAQSDHPDSERLLDSEKTRHEHALAADSVEEALAPYCSELVRSPVAVAGYGEISHLATTFTGEALTGTTVTELLAALHPTAAVAGTPTKSALELIREIEGHQRGRYAGPVGWMDREGEGQFAIALRCGLVEADSALLYAGAGLVRGSDPDHELAETRIKLRPMLRALGVS